jgi:hypothetical protein
MSLASRLGRTAVRQALRSPQLRRAVKDLGRNVIDGYKEEPEGTRSTRRSTRSGDTASGGHTALADRAASPAPRLAYAPQADGDADPGEVVWGWVPFEEDASQGKDRPLLVLALEDASVGGSDGSGQVVVGLMLTSRDRGDGTHTGERGHRWVDVGTGDWDPKGRPSEVRVDRLLRIPARSVRREGGRLPEKQYRTVVKETSRVFGWKR